MAKKMTILFDANPLASNTKSGVGYYTYHLILELARNHPDDIELVGHYFNFLNRRKMDGLPQAPNISYRTSVIWPGKILNICRRLGFQLPLEILFKQRGDVAIFTNFVALPSITRIPKVIVVHDLGFIDTPEYVSEGNRRFLLRFVARSIRQASLVVTVSEATKQQILKNYVVSADKISITPIPPTNIIEGDRSELKNLNIEGDYLLFVGTLEPRKNILNLVKSYELLPPSIKTKVSLVLAGGTGWYMDETLAYIADLQQKGENIILTGYVSAVQRATLYEHASLFVLPSHYEGFGMPILEAMSYGVPTAVSDLPVFHEVAGEASAYFDQNDPETMMRSIKKVLSDKKLQKSLSVAGTQQLKSYSWETVSASLYEALVRVAKT